MTQRETHRILQEATGGSPRTFEGWRRDTAEETNGTPKPRTVAIRIARAVMESLDRDGAPVRVGAMEIRARKLD